MKYQKQLAQQIKEFFDKTLREALLKNGAAPRDHQNVHSRMLSGFERYVIDFGVVEKKGSARTGLGEADEVTHMTAFVDRYCWIRICDAKLFRSWILRRFWSSN